MYEYQIRNIYTGEEDIIFGYNFADACRRAKIDPKDWDCWMWEYVD